MEKIFLSIIVPVYNEEGVSAHFIKVIDKVMIKINKLYEIIFINDGSKDNTLNELLVLKNEYKNIKIINLSRNFGKEAAMTAGFDYADGEVIIPMDVDLQDPPELIEELIKKWEEGYDVVLAKRSDRTSDSFFKRFTANAFYKFHNKISHIKIPENVGDYRLFSRKVLQAIQLLPENQRFMKGIFAWVGFKATTIEYARIERIAGKTSFNSWKLWNFAIEGITSFSTLPLRVWFYIGLIISTLSVIFGFFILIKTLLYGIDLPGYASMMITILFLGGIQLVGIGVLGEYIGRIYVESKNRPIYIIDKIFEKGEK